MFGLVVMEGMTLSGHLSNINFHLYACIIHLRVHLSFSKKDLPKALNIIAELTQNHYCNIFIAWSNQRGVRFGKHGFNQEIGRIGRISYPERATHGQI